MTVSSKGTSESVVPQQHMPSHNHSSFAFAVVDLASPDLSASA